MVLSKWKDGKVHFRSKAAYVLKANRETKATNGKTQSTVNRNRLTKNNIREEFLNCYLLHRNLKGVNIHD